jgi:hypothetical protein
MSQSHKKLKIVPNHLEEILTITLLPRLQKVFFIIQSSEIYTTGNTTIV